MTGSGWPVLSARARRLSPLARYAIAVLAAAVAALLRLALDPLWGVKLPLILFFPAVMVSGWFGGFWPGIVTTLLSAVAADFFWIPPVYSLAMSDAGDVFGLLVFVVVGVVISGLNEAWRRAAGRTAESEDRLRVTLGSIGDAVIATDEQGRITRINAVAQALTGWTEGEAGGRPLEDVFTIVDEAARQPVENPVQRVLREGAVIGLGNHTVLLSKDRREIPIEDSAAPIRAPSGPVTGVVIVFRDVSERRRAERERAALQDTERAARIAAETAERQLRFALEAGGMGTWQWTVRTGAVAWSSGLEAIHGFAPGTFPGTFEAFQSEIHPEDLSRVLQAIGEAVEQRRDHHIEYRIVRRDGTVRWVEGRGQLFCDAQGQPERLLGVCSDVTERKESEERFRLAIEAAPAAIVIVDHHGAIVLVNELLEQLLGYSRQEIIGQSIEQLVPPRFRAGHPQYRTSFFGDSRRRPMGLGGDLYALRKDGSEVPVEIGLSPLKTADGVLVMAAITDITDRKRAAELLEAAVRARDDFLSIASHELRNPINAVQLQLVGMLRALQRDGASLTPEWFRDRIGQANVQVSRLTRLTDNLLDVSRITAGVIVLEPEDVDFREVVRAVIEQFRDELQRYQISLRAAETPVIGHWDRLRLEQVVTNLLSNAIKYGAGKPIEVSLESDGGTARLAVTDHGIGIDEENQKRLFARFERAVSGLQYGGFGLGLWITRQLVEAMNGRISLESHPGRGSTFTVVVPRGSGGGADT